MTAATPASPVGGAGAAGAPASPGPPPAGLLLRPLRWWDLAAVAAVDRACFGRDAWSVETFLSELALRPSRDYAVLLDEEEAIHGYVGTAVAGSRADLQTIAVAPESQGRGLGRFLLAHARATAAARGARRLELEVRADNASALGLYVAAGFTVDGRRPGYYRDVEPGAPRVDAVLMHGDLRRP